MTGAALTILAELKGVMRIAPQLAALLDWVHATVREVWRPPLELVGLGLHHDLAAALNVAFFLALIGVGARVSSHLGGRPIGPFTASRFFDDQTWPSLIVFAAICLVFLVGRGAGPADPLVIFGSAEIGKYAFAIVVTIGYFLGDFIGHKEFHLRLYRLAVLVGVLIVVNFALLAPPAP